MQNLDKILEGILFLAGDGVDKGIIMEKLQVTPKQLDNAIEILKKRYNDESGISFITYKDKLQLCGNQKFADDVSVVLNPIRERQLTKATLEVMAIIAYKQPVTRLDVQEIRGINSDYAIQTLLNYKLIEVVGRKDAVGKPLLFGTTDEFLRHFGINQIEDLPKYDELMKDLQELQLQNNHLYNEFEIPNETEDEIANENDLKQNDIEDKNEDNMSEKVVEQENIVETQQSTTENTIEQSIDKQVEDNKNNFDKEEKSETENKQETTEKIDTKKEITEQSKDNVEIKPNKEQKNKSASKNKNSEPNKLDTGIDYSILNEEEQIEQTSNIFENLLKNINDNTKDEDKNDDADGIDWSILFDNPDIDQ